MKEFDAAKYFGTHPSLVNRRFNRPSLENLKKLELRGNLNEADLKVSELTLILELKRDFITFLHLLIKTKRIPLPLNDGCRNITCILSLAIG